MFLFLLFCFVSCFIVLIFVILLLLFYCCCCCCCCYYTSPFIFSRAMSLLNVFFTKLGWMNTLRRKTTPQSSYWYLIKIHKKYHNHHISHSHQNLPKKYLLYQSELLVCLVAASVVVAKNQSDSVRIDPRYHYDVITQWYWPNNLFIFVCSYTDCSYIK